MKMDEKNQKLFDLNNASTVLGGISEWTLRKHIRNGTVKVTRIGKRVMVSSAEIARIAEVGLPSLREGAN
jgi:hypothetical protein